MLKLIKVRLALGLFLPLFLIGSACTTNTVVSNTNQDSTQVQVNSAKGTNSQPASSSNTTTTTQYAPNGTYQNVYGNSVPRPYESDSVPAGASAQCRDGSYSFSQSRSGTCSYHGGVAEWL